jgi:hypothetical protein
MLKLKQKILAGILASFTMLIFASDSFAAGTTLIPPNVTQEEIDAADAIDDQAEIDRLKAQDSLAKKFQTGEFELYDLGTYVQYLIEFLIYFAGGIAVLFIVIGGYKYMVGSISDDKEAGKKTIAYALTGFAIAVLAWTIVNFIQVWLTSGS